MSLTFTVYFKPLSFRKNTSRAAVYIPVYEKVLFDLF